MLKPAFVKDVNYSQTKNRILGKIIFVRSNNLSSKFQSSSSSGCTDIGIKELEFVAKTQFLETPSGFTNKPFIIASLGVLIFIGSNFS